MAERKGESMLRSFAKKQAQQFNASPVSQAFNRDLERNFSAVAEALAVPGKAVRGEYNDRTLYSDGSISPVSEALIGDAAKLAGLAATGGMPMPRPVGSLGMFGGVRARTANMESLARAQQMYDQGFPQADVMQNTGWFKGQDGQWRFEIPDNTSTVDHTQAALGGAPDRAAPLPNVLKHSALYEAYPDLANINVAARLDAGGMEGHYALPRTVGNRLLEGIGAQAPTRNDLRSVLLHEVQHAIQQREGFSSGASPEMFQQQGDADLALKAISWRNEIAAKKAQNPNLSDRQLEQQVIDDYVEMGAPDWIPPPEARQVALDYDTNPTEQLQQVVDLYFPGGRVSPDTPRNMYERSAGEVEARNVQSRMNLTPEQRKMRVPWETQDTPYEIQILRNVSGE